MLKKIKKKIKKGFTLIELLAVIVILAVIALIITPVVTGIITKTKASADLRSAEGYVKAAEDFYASAELNEEKKNKIGTNIFDSITVSGGHASAGNILVNKKGQVTMSIVLNNKCYTKTASQTINEIQISDNIAECDVEMEPNIPELSEGMIPVNISDTGVVTKADVSNNWYNYSEKKWANMVLVSEPSRNTYKDSTPGLPINVSDILGYFVWIPRYRYQLFNAKGLSGTSPQEIKIKFENKNTPKATGTNNGEWLTETGFTFGTDNELNGIWFGKFETTGTDDTPTVLPNTPSLKNEDVSTQFYTSRKVTDKTKYGIENDAHMAKNSEWGTVAYLAHSKYGIQDEIRINNNSGYTTGCGAKKPNGVDSTTCQIPFGSGVSEYPQSTTGNISGIFDMTGGTMERVMGTYMYTSGSNGFSELPDPKYYEIYKSDQNILGDALLETRGWYGDSASFINAYNPWFKRGSGYYSGNYGQEGGSFSYTVDGYGGDGTISFRIVIAP